MVGAAKGNPSAVLDDLFGDSQRREGFAGAARHDETTPFVVREPGDRVLDGFDLERPRFLDRPFGVLLLNLDAEQLPEVDLGDLGMGIDDGPLGVRSPPARRHDPAQAEYRLLRTAQELVDLAFPEGPPLVVALALDGDPLAGGPPCDEVDADVAPVESGQFLPLRPVRPAPDRIDLELGPLKCDPHEQLLEPAALLGLVAALGADSVEDGTGGGSAAEVEGHL